MSQNEAGRKTRGQDLAGPASEATQSSFGFENVAPDDRQDRVNDVFSKVAGRYDLMNDLMSGGLHRLWKRDMITWLAPPKSDTAFQHLDVAGGTADIALRCLAEAGQNAKAIVCDISGEMLRAGREKIKLQGRYGHVTLVQGNAEVLPFPDRSMDAYTIAFGIRNVTHIDKALAEAYRVLRPGGRFLCLEFSEVQVPVLDDIYDLFSFRIIPKLGQLAAGDRASYQYLVESIRKFPKQDAFAKLIAEAGFSQVKYRNLSGGIAALHSGWRL